MVEGEEAGEVVEGDEAGEVVEGEEAGEGGRMGRGRREW